MNAIYNSRERMIGEQITLNEGTEIYNNNKKQHKRRINIVSIKMVKEGSVLYDTNKITRPRDIEKLGRTFLEDSDREKLVVCCMDAKNKPIAINEVSVGSLTSSIVHPREVFKAAILSNASSIILFHNHPSGSPEYSKEDLSVTKRIVESGKILGIPLLDHIIIGDEDRYFSFKEQDLL